MTEITTRPTISRRKIAQSMAWTVPVIALAGAAPAMAASRLGGCSTLKWTDTTLSGTQGINGIRSGSITLSDGSLVTVRVTQQRTGGQPGRKIDSGQQPTPSYGDFSATAAGAQQAWANGFTNSQSSGYVVAAGSTSSVLTLNQGSSSTGTRGQETLTFSFTSSAGIALTPKSITFNAYDVTSQVTNMNNSAYYTDSLSFAGATATYGTAVGSPMTYVKSPSSLTSTGTNTSTSTGNYIPVILTPTSATPQITYTNIADAKTLVAGTNGNNYQYVGIGDVTICF